MRLSSFAFSLTLCCATSALAVADTVGKKTYVCDCPCNCDASYLSEEDGDMRLSIGKLILNEKRNFNAGFEEDSSFLKTYSSIKDPRRLTDFLSKLTKEERALTLRYAALNSRVPHIQKLLLYVSDKNAVDTALLLTMSRLDDQFYFTPAISAFIKARADVNRRDPLTGLTPLMVLASSTTETQPLEMLLNAEADINAQNNIGMTPLMYAAQYSTSPDVVRFLIKAGADINKKDVSEKKALDHLRLNTSLLKDDAFDELRASLGEKITTQVSVKLQEFINCIMNGDIVNAREYLKTGVDVNTKNHDGESLLVQAFSATKPQEAVQFLLHEGADVNALDANGDTVLLTALKKVKNPEIIRMLLHAGADVNARNSAGDTPLKRAFLFNQPLDVINQLLYAGADKTLADKSGQTPLDYARERAFLSGDASYNALISLLEKDNRKEKEKELLARAELDKALQLENFSMVRSALKPLDINKRDEKGSTIFLNALSSFANKNTAIIRQYLDNGADLEQRHIDSSTPLIYAIRHGASPDVVALLTYAGVSIKAKDKNGRTAEDYIDESLTYTPDEMRDLVSLLSPEIIKDDDDLQTAQLSSEDFLNLIKTGSDADIFNALQEGDDANQTDENGNSLLMHLLRTPTEKETLKRLLMAGADVNKANKEGLMPLTYAMKRRQSPDIILLLLRAGAKETPKNTEEQIKYDRTIRRMIASGLQVSNETLSDFFNKGIIPEHEIINKAKEISQTSFLEDVMYLSVEKINELTPSVIDPNFVYPGGKTPIMLALSRWSHALKTAEIFAKAGADLNAKDEHGNTPLFYAVKNNDYDAVEWLIESKVDVNSFNNDGVTPLVFALSDKAMTKLLTQNGADINALDSKGRPLLMNAAKTPALFASMIKSGANINALDKDGNTPLMQEVEGLRNMTVIQEALNAGADINARNHKGETALIKAAVHSKEADETATAIVHMLIKAGANIDLKDNYGKTALIHAIEETSNVPVIQALLTAGADVSEKDNSNKSALDYAQKNTSLNLEADYGDILKQLQKQ